jgi:hypothetical protein
VRQRGAEFGLARADDSLLATLRTYGVLELVSPDFVFPQLGGVFEAWAAQSPAGPTSEVHSVDPAD